MGNRAQRRGPAVARCERCGAPLGLTPRGKLRRGKRFCSARCQQAAIKTGRAKARRLLELALAAVERLDVVAPQAMAIRRALVTLGVLRSRREAAHG